MTISGDVTLKVPKLKGIYVKVTIIGRYRRRERSVEEALIEMYLESVSFGVSRTLLMLCEAARFLPPPSVDWKRTHMSTARICRTVLCKVGGVGMSLWMWWVWKDIHSDCNSGQWGRIPCGSWRCRGHEEKTKPAGSVSSSDCIAVARIEWNSLLATSVLACWRP